MVDPYLCCYECRLDCPCDQICGLLGSDPLLLGTDLNVALVVVGAAEEMDFGSP
jgi:hypothetical protein